MVILLQLCLFCIAVFLRGRWLFGAHLKSQPHHDKFLSYASIRKGKVKNLHIGIPIQDGIPLIIKPERWYHRFLKNIGVASEIRMQDTEFDQKYFIITDFPGHLERVLASSELLPSLKKLFTLPVKSLHATSGKIWCVIKKEDLERSEAYFKEHAEILQSIAESIKSVPIFNDGINRKDNIGKMAFAFICAHAGLLTLGVFGIFPNFADTVDMTEMSKWMLKGIVFGGVVAFGWLLLLLHFFQRTSWVCWVLADFILCAVAGFLLSGIFIVRDANIHLPQPAATLYQSPVVSKECVLKCRKKCGRRCTRRSSYTITFDPECSPNSRHVLMQEKIRTDYICRANAWYAFDLNVPHWSKPEIYRFQPSEGLFDSVYIGSYISIPVNPGALGLEWVEIDDIKPE